MLEAEPSHKVLVRLKELNVSFKLLKHKDFQQIVDELTLKELHRFQVEKMIKEEGVGVSEAGHDAPLCFLFSLTCILSGVGAEQVHHHLAGLVCPAVCEKHLVQQPVQSLPLFDRQRRLGEQLVGGGDVLVHSVQLSSPTSNASAGGLFLRNAAVIRLFCERSMLP